MLKKTRSVFIYYCPVDLCECATFQLPSFTFVKNADQSVVSLFGVPLYSNLANSVYVTTAVLPPLRIRTLSIFLSSDVMAVISPDSIIAMKPCSKKKQKKGGRARRKHQSVFNMEDTILIKYK